jgi:hypothetical protein
MKFSIIALFLVFALSSCEYLEYSDLEGIIDKDKIIECIRGCEPVIEDIVEVIKIVQEKQWPELLTIGAKMLNDVKGALNKCPLKKDKETNLQGFKKLKKKLKKIVKKATKIGKTVIKVADKVNKVINTAKKVAPIAAAVLA